jgi:hypothetical protein
MYFIHKAEEKQYKYAEKYTKNFGKYNVENIAHK